MAKTDFDERLETWRKVYWPHRFGRRRATQESDQVLADTLQLVDDMHQEIERLMQQTFEIGVWTGFWYRDRERMGDDE